MRRILLSFTLALTAIAACVGSDPDPVANAPDSGSGTSSTSSSSSGSSEAGSGSSSSSSSSSSSGDASSDADADATSDSGPTCKPSKYCQDLLAAQIKNDCTPKLSSCMAGCTDEACKAGCRSSFNTCGSPYRNQCLTCAMGDHSCDPSADCYVPIM